MTELTLGCIYIKPTKKVFEFNESYLLFHAYDQDMNLISDKFDLLEIHDHVCVDLCEHNGLFRISTRNGELKVEHNGETLVVFGEKREGDVYFDTFFSNRKKEWGVTKKLKDVTIGELIENTKCKYGTMEDGYPLLKCKSCPFNRFLIDEGKKKWCQIGSVMLFAYGLNSSLEEDVVINEEK